MQLESAGLTTQSLSRRYPLATYVSKTDCHGGESEKAADVTFAARQGPQHVSCHGGSTDKAKTAYKPPAADSPALLHWRLRLLHQVDWDIAQYSIRCNGKELGDGVR